MTRSKIILIISPEAWGNNFVSKHHYAKYLSKEHEVYFLNPPNGFSRIPFGNSKIVRSKISDSLIIFSYRNLAPRLNLLPFFLQRWIYKVQAKKIKKAIGKTPDIIWSFDPHRFFDQTVWKSPITLYFSFDFHRVRIYERLISQSSDKVYTAAIGLKVLIQKEFGVEAVNLGHGLDLPSPVEEQVTLPGKNKTKIMYVGNISQFIDLDYFETIFQRFPDCDFIWIGPLNESSNLGGKFNKEIQVNRLRQIYGNVFFLGVVAPDDLYAYVSQADIMLLYNTTPIYNSHKLMLYFYGGSITLSTSIEEYEKDSFLMIQASSDEDFSNRLEYVINNLEMLNAAEVREKRRMYALENTYPKKKERIFLDLFGEQTEKV